MVINTLVLVDLFCLGFYIISRGKPLSWTSSLYNKAILRSFDTLVSEVLFGILCSNQSQHKDLFETTFI